MPSQIPQDIDFTKATRIKWANAPRGYHVEPKTGCWSWLLRNVTTDEQYELQHNNFNDNYTGSTLPALAPAAPVRFTIPGSSAGATSTDESDDESDDERVMAAPAEDQPLIPARGAAVTDGVVPNIRTYGATAQDERATAAAAAMAAVPVAIPRQSTVADFPNRFARYAYDSATWQTNGDFIIDLDNFLHDRIPLLDRTKRPDRLLFGLIGCHGVDTKYAIEYFKKESKALKVAAREISVAARHHFNFVLGDNFYHFGVTDPRSTLFYSCFHQYFKNTECFAVLGNHDYNMHGETDGPFGTRLFHLPHPLISKRYRAMCQVYHSYISPRYLNPFHRDGHPNVWNMPFRYYAMVAKGVQAVFICIDSNTLAFDAVQQIWLIETYTRLRTALPTYNFILISHHPLEYYSARAFKKKEWKKYRQSEDSGLPRTPFKVQGTVNVNGQFQQNAFLLATADMSEVDTIGHILKDFLQTYNIRFKAIFAAHEHLLAFEKVQLHYADSEQAEEINQFISGGGGAKLNAVDSRLLLPDARASFRLGTTKYFPQYGYMRVELDQNQLLVNFYGIKSAKPIHTQNIELRAARESRA
jgi:hypothetical protein